MVEEKIDDEINYLVIENTNNGPHVWRGTQKKIVYVAIESHGFDYQEFDKESFLDAFGDFKCFKKESDIINETGTVVMVSLNTDTSNAIESMPEAESKGIFKYALDSIFRSSSYPGVAFPESLLKHHLKNLNDEQVQAVKNFLQDEGGDEDV